MSSRPSFRFRIIAAAMSMTAPIVLLRSAAAQSQAIPTPVTAADYTDLLERPPFRKVLSLSESLVLSGVAALGQKKLVTVWNRTTGESFVATSTPNPQGWRLVDLVESTDLRHVTATIEVDNQRVTLRFDPERLAPPILDNRSKPAKRSEEAIVVEAMLRSLDPAAARHFETLLPEPQETFRKSFAEFLSTYPTAPDSRRLAFVRQALDEVAESATGADETAVPNPTATPAAAPAATEPAEPSTPPPAGPDPTSPDR
ncbi:MAG: hypothetical protein ACKV19_10320 [Verrucomicrobiales bacterium]